MLKLKAADFFVQLILSAIIVIMYALDSDHSNPFPFIIALGMIQVISITAHLLSGPQPWKIALRRYHLTGTIGVLIMIVVGFAIPRQDKYDSGGAIILVWALIPCIILAIVYIIVTGIEWQKLIKVTEEKKISSRR